MQDWPLEVADPERIDEFLALYESCEDENELFFLMQLVLYTLEELPQGGLQLWPRVEPLLVAHGRLHAESIIYWSCGEFDARGLWVPDPEEDHQFPIMPLARRALIRVRDLIRFDELWTAENAPRTSG